MKALICGAGIAGFTLAWHLERIGWDVEIVDHAPAFRTGGYLIDFYGPGYEVVKRMGLETRLRSHRQDVATLRYRDRAGAQTARLDLPDNFGDVVSVLRPDLAAIIADDTATPVHYGTSITAISQDENQVTVELTNGTNRTVDLLVGADGVNSVVRDLAFGPKEQYLRYLGYHVASYLVDDAELSDAIKQQYQMITVPARMAGAYGLNDGRFAALFLRHEPDPQLPADPAAVLGESYQDFGWLMPQILARRPQPPELYYDQVTQVEMADWNRGRVILLGDACQAVSLFAGQGASMGVAGAAILAGELESTPTDPAAAARRYQDRIQPTIVQTQRLGRSMVQWMAPQQQWRITVRDWTTRLARLPGLNRLFVKSLTPGNHKLITQKPTESEEALRQ